MNKHKKGANCTIFANFVAILLYLYSLCEPAYVD